MEFKLGSYTDFWKNVNLPENADDNLKNEINENVRRLSQFISDILLCENLVVLTGLGTSLSALKTDKEGKKSSIAPKMSDLWSAVKGIDNNRFKKILSQVKYDLTKNGENIELLLSRCQLFEKIQHTEELGKFIKEAEETIVKLCDFIDDSVDIESHEMFLRKVARRGARLPRTQIFTTNYDLCFEKAASRGRFVLLDGFSLSTPPEFDGTYFNFDLVSRGSEQSHLEFLPNVFQLCKLHGSIDWENLNGVIQKTTNRKSPCIIYPQEGKYESSFSSPYLEIMGRLQNSLRKPNLGLIVVGFGFNDNHISHPIMQALRSNVNMKMLIVDPSIKTTSNSYLNQISKLTSSGDWRVGLLSGTFENFVKFVPDLIKESESEVHFQRVRSAF